MVNICHLRNVHGKGSVVLLLLQNGNNPPVLYFALTHAHLKGFFTGITQLHVIDVLHNFVEAAPLKRAKNIVAGVQREPQTLHIIAQDRDGIGVFGKPAGLAF